MKKGLAKIFAVITALAIVAVCSVNAFAAATEKHNGFGTEASGIVGNNFDIWHNDATEGPKNLDFSEGFKYWGSQPGDSPANYAQIVEKDGAKCLHLTPKKQYDGIQSTPFTLSDLRVGTKVSLVYDWKGEGDFAIQINQIDSSAGWIASYPDHKIIPDDEDAWITTMSTPVGSIVEETSGAPATFAICIQAGDTDEYIKDNDVYITNIRFVTVSDDGEVKEYGTGKTIEFPQPSSDETPDDDTGTDSIDDIFGDDTDDAKSGTDTTGDTDTTGADETENDSGFPTWLIIVIAAVVVVAGAVVACIIIKKKKAE